MNSNDQPTMPNPALQPSRARRTPAPPPAPTARRPVLPRRPLADKRPRPLRWLLALGLLCAALATMVCGLTVLAVGAVYARGILPGVYVGAISVGGMTQRDAAFRLQTAWSLITLRDGDRQWTIAPEKLGLTIDIGPSVAEAQAQGRTAGSALVALLGRAVVKPHVTLDMTRAEATLSELSPQFDLAPLNAGVAFEDGRVIPTAPRDGRALDLAETLRQLRHHDWDSPFFTLAMRAVPPSITDASAMVAEAERLLSSPLVIRVYDPVTDDSVLWSLPPQEWARWLTAQPDPNRPSGLALAIAEEPVRHYLSAQAANVLDASRGLDIEQGVQSVRDAIANGQPQGAYVLVKHQPRQHTVRDGETLTSIAWDYGIPYLYIQRANGGLDTFSAGQVITIPAADSFLLYPIVPHKRIVVSISQQRTWVYENGQLKWDWPASTGISSSPTWPGIYQILSHEPNAYASNWNLWMPQFMGVYQPVPGADFTNGFHGFPTRGGGQLLWENSLGTRVTYGCILLSDSHIQLLYAWAERGVVVEILP